MVELKPCPFCGGEVSVMEEWVDAISTFYTFACDECDMYVTYQYSVPKAEAIEAWNRRAEDGK